MNSVMKTQSRPSTGSLVSVTSKGEVCIFDSTAMEKSGLDALEKRTQDDGVCHRDLEQMEPKVISLTPFEGGKLVILLHNST